MRSNMHLTLYMLAIEMQAVVIIQTKLIQKFSTQIQ